MFQIKVSEEGTSNSLFPLKSDFHHAYPNVSSSEDENAWSWDSNLGELQKDNYFQIQDDVGEDDAETACRDREKELIFTFQNFENFERRGNVEQMEASINGGGDVSRLLQETMGKKGSLEIIGDSLEVAHEKSNHNYVTLPKNIDTSTTGSMSGDNSEGLNGNVGPDRKVEGLETNGSLD
ncbi:hypothetical protein SLE2022_291920 [Rubroshorea leprosula]